MDIKNMIINNPLIKNMIDKKKLVGQIQKK